jgi:hypothetical protein
MAKASNPLDDGLFGDDEGADDGPLVSREEAFSHFMGSLNFRPKEAKAKGTLEFVKMYSDPSGRVSRVIAVVKKDDVGLEPQGLDYVTITIQETVRATEEDIQRKAPAFCRSDILHILSQFGDTSFHRDTPKGNCASCGVILAEFVQHEAKPVCLDCARRKGIV